MTLTRNAQKELFTGHTVMKCAAGVGMPVDTTASVFELNFVNVHTIIRTPALPYELNWACPPAVGRVV